ncbi:DNA-binding protein [Lactococcus garvieae]|uniref:DNA-binding protein n=1 Tax=Lactococcus garvieae TaxID=1363 RepID=UPI003D167AE7
MNKKLYATKLEIAEMFSIPPHTLDNILTEVRRNSNFANIILKWGVKSVRVNILGFENFYAGNQNNESKKFSTML